MTFLFSTTNTILSRAIRALSSSAVSHCGVGVTIAGVPVVVDSSLLGVEMVERTRWFDNREVVIECLVPEEFAPPLAYIMRSLGQGYDYSGMFGYLPVYIARWFGRKINNPWASPTRLVCSEFIIRGVIEKDQKWGGVLDAEFCDPERLMSFCLTAGFPRTPALP